MSTFRTYAEQLNKPWSHACGSQRVWRANLKFRKYWEDSYVTSKGIKAYLDLDNDYNVDDDSDYDDNDHEIKIVFMV